MMMKNKKSKRSNSHLHFERERSLLKCKCSQITIFVIIAIIIVIAIASIFVLVKKPAGYISPSENPKAYIQKCAADAAAEAERQIIPHGGFLNPSSSLKYNNVDVVWMCYTPFNEQLCTNKHPMLTKEIEKEIKAIIEPEINKCFADVKNKLVNYNYKEQSGSVSVSILPKQVYISIAKEISYTKQDQKITISNFDTAINSALYEFTRITSEAINQEVTCDCGEEACNADITALNRYNRDFEISRFVSGKNEKVYTIKDILTKKEFNFAVRNCVRLP